MLLDTKPNSRACTSKVSPQLKEKRQRSTLTYLSMQGKLKTHRNHINWIRSNPVHRNPLGENITNQQDAQIKNWYYMMTNLWTSQQGSCHCWIRQQNWYRSFFPSVPWSTPTKFQVSKIINLLPQTTNLIRTSYNINNYDLWVHYFVQELWW